MNIAYIGLAGRILLLGVERIIVKRLGTQIDPAAGAFHLFFIGAVALIPWATGGAISDWTFLKPMAFASFIYALAFILYVRSLADGEASLVGPLYNFNVFFLSIGAWAVLREPLPPQKIAGLIFLLIGASFLTGQASFEASVKALYTDSPCRHMMAASLLIACGRIIDKNLVGQVPPLAYAIFLYLAIACWLALYLVVMGRGGNILQVIRQRPRIAITCGVVNGYSYLCLLWALGQFNVSLVEPLSMLSILVTMALSKYILTETLGNRIWAAIIMIGGAALIV